MLIFASLGLSSGLIGQAEYGALLIVVFVNTFLPPMVLKQLSR